MSRILLTDAEQLRSKIEGVGFQVAAVLAAPNGGVTLELLNPVTEAKEVINLPREQAQTLVEQVGAALRCAPLASHTPVPTTERYRFWNRQRLADDLAALAFDGPETETSCIGSRAVG
ncbi:hypothetical protein [Deinococcus sp. UYEF24]